jgi:hypothetical protein
MGIFGLGSEAADAELGDIFGFLFIGRMVKK